MPPSIVLVPTDLRVDPVCGAGGALGVGRVEDSIVNDTKKHGFNRTFLRETNG